MAETLFPRQRYQEDLRETTPNEDKLEASIRRMFSTHAPHLYDDFIRFYDRTGADFKGSK